MGRAERSRVGRIGAGEGNLTRWHGVPSQMRPSETEELIVECSDSRDYGLGLGFLAAQAYYCDITLSLVVGWN